MGGARHIGVWALFGALAGCSGVPMPPPGGDDGWDDEPTPRAAPPEASRDAPAAGSGVVLSPAERDRIQQEKRHALVIGNGAYAEGRLANPANDARSMTAALRKASFEVTTLVDADQRSMIRAIRAFGDVLEANGGVGLFYYAGHGMQVKGRNYLIPLQAEIDGEAAVEVEAVDVARVLAAMEDAGNRLNVVILDACRNNPFARSWRSGGGGLAYVDAPRGTLLSYATAPGSVASDGTGDNGLFTSALAARLVEPGLTIENVFKAVRTDVRVASGGRQLPWESSSLEGDFFFVVPKDGRVRSPAASSAPVASAAAPVRGDEPRAPLSEERLTRVRRLVERAASPTERVELLRFSLREHTLTAAQGLALLPLMEVSTHRQDMLRFFGERMTPAPTIADTGAFVDQASGVAAKVEVVRILRPHIGDPENALELLSRFPHRSDRDTVRALFE